MDLWSEFNSMARLCKLEGSFDTADGGSCGTGILFRAGAAEALSMIYIEFIYERALNQVAVPRL